MTASFDHRAVMAPTADASVSDWLTYMGSIHVSAIDMGLERVLPVFEALKINKGCGFVFTVAGTNGKGSTTAAIAQICQEAGYKTALYQSPHLVSFNERIRINGQMVNDKVLIDAFVAVEAARLECKLSLSFFEMTTLAAFYIFAQNACEVWVLEVGLGGRLDVVNVIDPNLCVITNVAIDHTDWLGDTREKIGAEKAGILRQNSTLIYGEEDMPDSINQAIAATQSTCYQKGVHYDWRATKPEHWVYSSAGTTMLLPTPALSLDNISTAVSAVLASGLSIERTHIASGLRRVQLAGRFDKRRIKDSWWLFDVAHNEAGVRFLMSQFIPVWQAHQAAYPQARLQIIFSMLADKDVDAVTKRVATTSLPISAWHVAQIDNVRALSLDELSEYIDRAYKTHHPTIYRYQQLAQAVDAVTNSVQAEDFVLVFGSFYTISESLIALNFYPDFKKH